MNAYRTKYVLSVLVSLGSLSSVACDGGGTDPVAAAGATSVPTAGSGTQPTAGSGNVGGTGGGGLPGLSGGSGGGSGSGSGDPTKVVVIPDETGWVDYAAEWNTVGVQGAWYPYGDANGDANCIAKGMHTAAECSKILTPTPPPEGTGFPNTGGKMCTSGEVAKAKCDTCTTADWSNIWGAGIGLDLAGAGGEPTTTKKEFKALASGIIGVGFNYTINAAGFPLRVEFPMNKTEGHPDGSNYWKAATGFPATIPKGTADAVGQTTWYQVLWSEETIKQPGKGETPHVPFNPDEVTGIQFHVFAAETKTTPYDFCISDLTFIVDPLLVKKAENPGPAAGAGGTSATGGAGGAPAAGAGGTSAGAPSGAGADTGGAGGSPGGAGDSSAGASTGGTTGGSG